MSSATPNAPIARPARERRRLAGVVRNLGLLLALLIGLNVAFLLALTLSQYVSSARILSNLRTAAATGQLTSNEYPTTPAGGPIDSWDECISLGLNTTNGDENPFERAIDNSNLGSCRWLAPSLLGDTPSTGAQTRALHDDIFRYWLGYQLLSRPVLALAGVNGIRVLGLGALLVALALLGWGVARTAGLASAVALLGPLVLFTDFADLPLAFTQAIGVAAALGSGAIVMLACLRWEGQVWPVAAAALAAGAVFNFLDFLINPPIALMLAVFSPMLWTALSTHASWYRGGLGRGAATAVAWIVGYAGTWLLKWLLAAEAYGFAAVEAKVREQIELRVSGSAGASTAFGSATLMNFSVYHRWSLWLLLGIAVVLAGVALYRRGARAVLDAAVLCLPATVSVLWFETLRQHSVQHFWFTYRSFAVSFGIGLAALLIAARRGHRRRLPFDACPSQRSKKAPPRPPEALVLLGGGP
jgi:hypothetical protein